MKRVFYALMSFMFFALSANLLAQGPPPPMEMDEEAKLDELKEYREELFKQKLKLTDSEAKEFFPVFDEYQLELRKSKRAFRKKWYPKNVDELSDSEAKEYFNDAVALQQNEIDLLKKYSNKLADVIGMNRVVKMPKIQREVRTLLVMKADEMEIKKREKPRRRR
jgi:anion-transporting  ArsA/GET3 family ATPase